MTAFLPNNSLLPECSIHINTTVSNDIPTLLKIEVSVSITGKFKAAITRGDNTQVTIFKDGIDLNPEALNIFEVLVHPKDSVNFRYSTTKGTIQILRVQEIDAAT